MRTDLHIHTTASDGCWTPERLIKGIVESGIQLFAITDHDSIDNVLETERLSKVMAVNFVRGVEISTTFHGTMIHILGYGIDPDCPSLVCALAENRDRLEQVDNRDIKKLIALGYPLSYADYTSYSYDKTRGGWKSLNYLIDQHLCTGPTDFFSTIRPQIGNEWPVYLSLTEVVDVIHDAGGVPIIAHPGASLQIDSLEDTLLDILQQGIQGVECFAQYHDKLTTERCVTWCRSHGLYITGGSDYHGGFVNRVLGKPIIDHEVDLDLGPIFHNVHYK